MEGHATGSTIEKDLDYKDTNFINASGQAEVGHWKEWLWRVYFILDPFSSHP